MVVVFLLAHYAAGWSQSASIGIAAGFLLIATIVCRVQPLWAFDAPTSGTDRPESSASSTSSIRGSFTGLSGPPCLSTRPAGLTNTQLRQVNALLAEVAAP